MCLNNKIFSYLEIYDHNFHIPKRIKVEERKRETVRKKIPDVRLLQRTKEKQLWFKNNTHESWDQLEGRISGRGLSHPDPRTHLPRPTARALKPRADPVGPETPGP